MTKWETVKLGDYVEQIRGVSYKPADLREFGSRNSIPILRAHNVQDSGLNYNDLVFVDSKKVSQKQLLQLGDIVVCASSGSKNLVGKAAQVVEGCEASFGAFCKVVRTTKIDQNYLSYYFQGAEYRCTISQLAAGANINNIRNEHIDNLEIPLPPLSEQRRLAAILDEADAIRKTRAESLRLLDELVKSTFLDMFGDPVSNPMGWEIKTIGDLVEVSTGKTPSRTNPSYFEGTIPWVKTTEVNGAVIKETEESISENAVKECTLKIFPVGSIIVALYGQGKTRGRSAILGIPATTNQACAVLFPSKKCETGYLFSFLQNTYERLRELGRGGNQPNLNLSIIREFPLPLPPVSLQRRFSDFVQEVERQRESVRSALAESENLFASLSQRAFRGEL